MMKMDQCGTYELEFGRRCPRNDAFVGGQVNGLTYAAGGVGMGVHPNMGIDGLATSTDHSAPRNRIYAGDGEGGTIGSVTNVKGTGELTWSMTDAGNVPETGQVYMFTYYVVQ
jgi:hypothetical protein